MKKATTIRKLITLSLCLMMCLSVFAPASVFAKCSHKNTKLVVLKEVTCLLYTSGIFFGVALPSVLVTIINKYGNYQLYLRLSWINILGLIVLFTLVILFVFFISIIRLLKLPLRGKLQHQTESVSYTHLKEL